MYRRVIPAALAVCLLAIVAAGCGGRTISMPVALLKSCGGHIDLVSGGNAIARVGQGQCASADNGATIQASGNAIVAAHGANTIVDARDKATVIVYNGQVKCYIRGHGVAVINAIGRPQPSQDPPPMDSSCHKVHAP